MSTISACTMTICSIPFAAAYMGYGLEGTFERGEGGWLGGMGRFGILFFGTYLFGLSSPLPTLLPFYVEDDLLLWDEWFGETS